MNAIETVKVSLKQADMIVLGYLEDLSDADLLVRATPGINHIAWQLGHLIFAENHHINQMYPGSMPALPDGFAEKHKNDTAANDSAEAFYPKSVYMDLLKQQRQGTLAALEKVTEADLDKPAPEALRNFVPTVGDVFVLQATHWLMHAGQWAVVRRKLGRKPLF